MTHFNDSQPHGTQINLTGQVQESNILELNQRKQAAVTQIKRFLVNKKRLKKILRNNDIKDMFFRLYIILRYIVFAIFFPVRHFLFTIPLVLISYFQVSSFIGFFSGHPALLIPFTNITTQTTVIHSNIAWACLGLISIPLTVMLFLYYLRTFGIECSHQVDVVDVMKSKRYDSSIYQIRNKSLRKINKDIENAEIILDHIRNNIQRKTTEVINLGGDRLASAPPMSLLATDPVASAPPMSLLATDPVASAPHMSLLATDPVASVVPVIGICEANDIQAIPVAIPVYSIAGDLVVLAEEKGDGPIIPTVNAEVLPVFGGFGSKVD